jgi:hypothetical protein
MYILSLIRSRFTSVLSLARSDSVQIDSHVHTASERLLYVLCLTGTQFAATSGMITANRTFTRSATNFCCRYSLTSRCASDFRLSSHTHTHTLFLAVLLRVALYSFLSLSLLASN